MRNVSIVSVSIGMAACAGPVGDPVIEAHRAGAGYWPGNSRTAVAGALAEGFDGIEVDLALTSDDVPVLANGPVLDPERCTLDGAPLPAPLTIGEITLEELAPVLCGGTPDPEFVNAVVVAEPLMTFDALLVALKSADPRTVVHLDIETDAASAERFAVAVLDRWFAADLPNPWYVSADAAETLRAFEDEGRLRGLEVPSSLVYPPAGASSGWQAELRHAMGLDSYVAIVEDAGADGITLDWELAERQQLHVLRLEGYTVGLSAVNTPEQLDRYARWPVDHLLTDYPGDRP